MLDASKQIILTLFGKASNISKKLASGKIGEANLISLGEPENFSLIY